MENGKRLSTTKQQTFSTYFSDPNATLPEDNDERDYLTGPGGPIWRAFYLHCRLPEKYPIFDQHVYRAMRFVTLKSRKELPKGTAAVAKEYVNKYLLFFRSFETENPRRVHMALWQYGKFLKTYQDMTAT